MAALAVTAVVGGMSLRLRHVADRPLHADEAVQGWLTWRLLDGHGDRYDPVDRHGPWLYFGAAAWTRARGGDARSLDDAGLRRFMVVAGVALLALVAWGARGVIGPGGAAVAALFVAASPLATLYATYFVQEAWLALWVWAFVLVGLSGWLRGGVARAVVLGALAGLATTCKAIAPVYLGVAAIAAWWLKPGGSAGDSGPGLGLTRGLAEVRPGGPRPTWWALGAFAVVYAVFFSSFGANPTGLLDGVRTYVLQAGRVADGGQSQPFAYFFAMLWPHRAGGLSWGETGLLTLAAAGAVLAWRSGSRPGLRVVAGFTAALLLLHSVIPYKTPWLLLTPWIGLALLAGAAVAWLAARPRWGLLAAVAVGGLAVAELGWRSHLALDRYPGDARNPYFLEQTPRGFTRLLDRLEALRATVRDGELAVAVVSEESAWPLPWYLRDWPQVGYFETMPTEFGRWDVVVRDLRVPEVFDGGDRVVDLHGLRPNVILTCEVRPEVWTRAYPAEGDTP